MFLACTVCMGGQGTLLAEAANGAIFLMLGLLFFIFSCLIGAGVALARRARLPEAEHHTLLRSISAD